MSDTAVLYAERIGFICEEQPTKPSRFSTTYGEEEDAWSFILTIRSDLSFHVLQAGLRVIHNEIADLLKLHALTHMQDPILDATREFIEVTIKNPLSQFIRAKLNVNPLDEFRRDLEYCSMAVKMVDGVKMPDALDGKSAAKALIRRLHPQLPEAELRADSRLN